MRSSSWMVFALISLASTQPTIKPRDIYDWTPSLAGYYGAVGKHIATIRDTPSFPNPPPCNLQSATMPVAPTPLAGPTAGLQLSEVLIGRGTQNYTCADSTAQSMPVSIGAVANLYNASCIAGNYPDLLALLPNVTLQLPVPAPESTLFPPNIDLVGHHFFTTITEPTFNLDTNTGGNLGIIFSSKNGTTTAPPNSPKGQDDQGFGSVAWLKLVAKNGTVGGYQEVYRVNTAGGNPPATCDGMQPTFEVQYAAQYWMYV